MSNAQRSRNQSVSAAARRQSGDWYAWGEEAPQAARAQNKPILLSPGYRLPLVHVMAHESSRMPKSRPC
jgi:uncharacterized protein YyaL (SSP411 family)